MHLLEVDDVTVRFGGVTALDHTCFTVEAGEVAGLIGPNGAGKTTCFDVVSGLRRPSTGAVRFAGHNVTRVPVHRRARRGMARTFQRLEAFGSLSVRDNVRVARDLHLGVAGLVRPDHGVDELLERVGIRAYADERADAVPTGVARLLELARCLAREPRLLLLDEPSSGLDEAETDALAHLLGELSGEGRAILLVEHDMDLVMGVCDTIRVLDFGRVIAVGAPAAVRADPVVRRAYLGGADAVSDAVSDTLSDRVADTVADAGDRPDAAGEEAS